jgi:outer membrane protein TolC
VSAADARDTLEAAIWRATASRHTARNAHVLAALSFADAYADARAAEAAGRVTEQTAARLTAASAEACRKAVTGRG